MSTIQQIVDIVNPVEHYVAHGYDNMGSMWPIDMQRKGNVMGTNR